jgi:hypothetical protein
MKVLATLFCLLVAIPAAVAQSGGCTIPAGASSCNFTAGGTTYTITQSQPSYIVSVAGTSPPAFSLKGSTNALAGSNQYLQRAFGTSTNQEKGTWAGWIARNSFNASGATIFSTTASGGFFAFGGSVTSGGTANTLTLNFGGAANIISSATITDFIWHHIMLAWDTTQATPAQRVHIYLDGLEVSYSIFNAPAQNSTIGLNISATLHEIGALNGLTTIDCDCQFADVHFVDGQQLTPSAFTTGRGAGTTFPAPYAGTNGANGFWLSFCDAGHIGADDGAGAQCSFRGSNAWTQVNGVGWQASRP